jgi:hypothetical protein
MLSTSASRLSYFSIRHTLFRFWNANLSFPQQGEGPEYGLMQTKQSTDHRKSYGKIMANYEFLIMMKVLETVLILNEICPFL